MNSYKTLAAAAHISGIPVRYAVSFGQAWHARQDRKHTSRAYSLADLVHEATLGDAAKVVGRQYVGAVRVKDDPVGRWNAEDKERQLRLKGMGGTAAAAAGGTSWLRYSVRRAAYSERYDVVDTKGRVQATFGKWHWANVAAQAWNADMSVASYGRAKMIDVSGFTLA